MARLGDYSNSLHIQVSQNSTSYTCSVTIDQLVHVTLLNARLGISRCLLPIGEDGHVSCSTNLYSAEAFSRCHFYTRQIFSVALSPGFYLALGQFNELTQSLGPKFSYYFWVPSVYRFL